MKRSSTATIKKGWHGYGGPDTPDLSTSSSENNSPVSKSRRETSYASDTSQTAFDFTGLDQTFVQGPNESLSLEMCGTRKGGKHTPQKPVPPKPIPVTPASKSIPVTSEATVVRDLT
jgi:hypothetical protein